MIELRPVWVIFTEGAYGCEPTDVVSEREDGDTLPNETAVEYVPLAEVDRLREALREMTAWAEAARGHYGIEECAGPGQPATEWDEIQKGLRNAALFARSVLDAPPDPSPAPAEETREQQ